MSAARVQVVLLWHFHQPAGRDPLDGTFVRPCARRHALADQLGMLELLDETPGVHVTLSLSPATGDEIEACAAGEGGAGDPLRGLSQRPAEELDEHERAGLIEALAAEQVMRRAARFPRQRELAACRGRASSLSLQDLRDAQVLLSLVFCDAERRRRDPLLSALVAKGRGYDRDDQLRLVERETALLGAILPAFARAREQGRVELCATPYDQPILPLLCDTQVHHEAHPGASLPRRYARPEDACRQLERALEWHRARFGHVPAGVWPPEAALSDAVLSEIARAGLRWTATDESLLERSLRHALTRDARGLAHPLEMLYRPWLRRTGEGDVNVLFRDRVLSDLIGFAYAREDPQQAAGDLVERLRRVGRAWGERGLDGEPVVGIMLDGDRPWEHYPDGGRPFLRALYRSLERDPGLRAVSVSEALESAESYELPRLASGSWRPGELSSWIGQVEQNRAWGLLGAARETLEVSRGHVPPGAWVRAHEALDAAGAADWFRAYGDEPAGLWQVESDRLFRRQLEAVYHWLALPVPEALRTALFGTRRVDRPASATSARPVPHLDVDASGRVSWARAAVYSVAPAGGRETLARGRVAGRAGHVAALRYGLAAGRLFVSLDTAPAAVTLLEDFDLVLAFSHRGVPRYRVRRRGEAVELQREEWTAHGWLRLPTRAAVSAGEALELTLPLAELRHGGAPLGLRVALVRFEAEIERCPGTAPLLLDLAAPQAASRRADDGEPAR